MRLPMPSHLTLKLLVPSSYFAASVFRGRSREARGAKERLKRLLSQQPGTCSSPRTYLCRVEVSDGNALAGLPVCSPHDAQESGFYHSGRAMPDAWDRSHHRDIHGGQCRAPSATTVLASRAAYPRLHGISDVSKRRPAPLLVRNSSTCGEIRIPGHRWMRGSLEVQISLARRSPCASRPRT